MTTPLEQWTLWQEVFLANHSVSQDSDEARTMTVTSGLRLLPLLRENSPLGCLSKMFLVSSAWHSTSYKLTWKAQATPRKRMYFRLAPSVHRTLANASSLWPTPLAGDGEHGGPNSRDSRGRYSLTGLVHHAWPTPVALDAGSGRINRSLSPNATERPTLAMMARKGTWPTPTANDSKNATLPPGAEHRDSLPGALMQMETRHTGNLNPEWVESLMGFPVGWTALDGPLPRTNRKRNGSRRVPSHTS